MIKNRDNIYLVIRTNNASLVVCSAHPTEEAAQDEVDNNTQQMKDRGFDDFEYHVWVTTYYDET